MNSKQLLVGLGMVMGLSACSRDELTTAASVAMANPASVACVKAGGKTLPRHGTQGADGFCEMPSGRVCEEWALFRGECR